MTRKSTLLAAGIAAALVVLAIVLALRLLQQAPPRESAAESPMGAPRAPSEPSAAPSETERRIRATLYFLSNSGTSLTAEEREIPFAATLQSQARQVVQELLRGSRRGLGSPFPEGVVLRDVFISPQGLAYVDLSQEVVSNHPGGSVSEQLTVYSLSNTLTTNFPAVKKVQLLVEGREVETLAGHLDLTMPYGRSLRWIEGSEPRSDS